MQNITLNSDAAPNYKKKKKKKKKKKNIGVLYIIWNTSVIDI